MARDLEWVEWFNHRRLLEPIGNIPAAEAEARYHDQTTVQAVAACAKPNNLGRTEGVSAYAVFATKPDQSELVRSLSRSGHIVVS